MQIFRGMTSLYSKNPETGRVNKLRIFLNSNFIETIAVLFCVGFLFSGFSVIAQAETNYCNDASVAGCWYMDGTTGVESDRSSQGNNLIGAEGTKTSTVPTSPVYTGFSKIFSAHGYLYKDVEGGVLDINGATAKVSITAWIKVISDPGSGGFTIVAKYNNSNNQRQYMFQAIGTGSSHFKLVGYISSNGTTYAAVNSTTTTYAFNTWYHVAFVDNNTDLRIYVNGLLDSTPLAYTGGIFNGNDVFEIGAQNVYAGGFFKGNIDEVAVFNRALSSTEVSEIYNSGISGNNGASDSDISYNVYYNTDGVIPSPIYTQTSADIDALCATNPTWSCVTYGQSAQGRDIRGIVITPSGYTKTILLDGAMHGNETIMTKAVLDFLSYLSANPGLYPNIRWVTAPLLNPDGATLDGGAKNNNTTAIDAPTPRRVNLNRNFPQGWGVYNGLNPISTDPSNENYIGPYAESEPETVVMENIIQTYYPNQHFNGHRQDNVFEIDATMSTTNITNIATYLLANGLEPLGFWRTNNYGGLYSDYARANGVESYLYEEGNSGNIEEINRYIGAVKALADLDPIYANGRCGANNGGSFNSLTSNNSNEANCSQGTVASFTGTGPWTWHCAGVGGGTDSGTCSASINQYSVTPSTGTGGTISPATAQLINYGTTTQFTVNPSAGTTVGGTCGGSLVGNIYTTNTIASNCTVSAIFDVTPPTNVGISSISVNSSTQLTVIADTATDAESGLASAPYWFTETSGNPGANSSTDWQTSNRFVDTGLSSEYQYTYKVKVRDAAGNISDYSAEVSATPYVVAGGSSYVSTTTTTTNNTTEEITSPTAHNDENTITSPKQTLTDQQRTTLITQIKEQLVVLITQLIQLLNAQVSGMSN